MRRPQDLARRMARLEWFGFTAEQAAALAAAGFDIVFVPSELVGL